jgi:hypothetical protein
MIVQYTGNMKTFHPLSFGLGLVSGCLILFLAVSMFHIGAAPRVQGRFAGNGGPNLERMAQRFGMTQDELQKEIDSGKTMQQIAAEHGVQFGGGFRQGQTSAAVQASSMSGASQASSQ